jgi:UDP-N-acetylmuramate dehydrogenase
MSPPAGLRERVPLAPFTTLGIGGPARYLLEAEDEKELVTALAWAGEQALPVFVLGGGSNLLVADEGFAGLVVRVALRGVRWEDGDGTVGVRAAAGEPWDPLVAAAVERRLAGLECLSGIPGSVGATPIQNVGAYGQEVAETIVEVEALSRVDGTRRHFAAADCGFAYRDSIWKRSEHDRWVIVAVSYRLAAGGAPAVRYAELQRYLGESGHPQPDLAPPDLARVREAVLALRRRKGMVIDAGDPDTRSDGSFFVNPVIATTELPALLERVAAAGVAVEGMPRFAAADGVKLSAAWLIERAGFAKGYRHGSVGISSKHALALVNRGGGTAREMLELVRDVRRRVADRFGVLLVPEPNFVGFAGDPLGAP